MKKNILINSEDRTFGTSDNFQIKYKMRQSYRCQTLYVSSVVMPSSFYVINSNNNLLYFINNNSISYTFTIKPGNYSPSELVTTIQTDITSLSSAYTISYNNNTGMFSFSTSSLAFGLDGTQINNILTSLMGFSATITSVNTTTKTSTNVADLSGPKYVQIISNALSYKSSFEPGSTTKVKDVLLRIPVKVNSFDMIVYEDYNDNNNDIPYDREFPNIIDISLVDEEGNALSLNGCDWSFNIVAHFTYINSC